MSFDSLGLSEPLLRAVREQGYQTPTPIQAQSIPAGLAGRDVLGSAQTGTGKTAAFALPILQRLVPVKGSRAPRALIVSPTRELAVQIDESFRAYGKYLGLRSVVLFGGVSQFHQVDALRRGIDILVATPGRLLDLYQQRHIVLAEVEILVLDEADRMLDMGFMPDVRRIIAAVPGRKQTLFYSATMPTEIAGLATQLLRDPVRVSVVPPATTAEKVDQVAYMVTKDDKPALLIDLLADRAMSRVLVFTRTKHGANRLCEKLGRVGIGADAIHGNKSQNARQRALEMFRQGKIRVLVASDIAARGLDIDDVSHVVNFDVPNEPETYVHRIGRTARAGASGKAITLVGHDERGYLRDIEKTVRMKVPVASEHRFAAAAARLPETAPEPQQRGGRGRGGGGRPQQQARSGGGGRPQQPRGGGGGGRPQQRGGGGGGRRDVRPQRDWTPRGVATPARPDGPRPAASSQHQRALREGPVGDGFREAQERQERATGTSNLRRSETPAPRRRF